VHAINLAGGRVTRASQKRNTPRVRVIDLDTGDTLQAANDDDLVRAVLGYYEDRGQPTGEDEARRLVSERAYTASDS
jgi:hypothetical protein